MAEELLACPFCGANRAYVQSGPDGRRGLDVAVFCNACDASTAMLDTPGEAVAAWNRRPSTMAPLAVGSDPLKSAYDGPAARPMLDAYRSLAAQARRCDHPDEDPCEAFRAVDSEARKIAALLEKKGDPQQ